MQTGRDPPFCFGRDPHPAKKLPRGQEEPLPPGAPEAAHAWHSGREKAKPKRYSVKKIFTLKTPSFAEMDKFPLYFSTIMRMLFMPKP